MQTPNGINSTLSIAYSDRQDSGVYKCVAENAFGKSEYIIYVAVQGMYIRPLNHIPKEQCRLFVISECRQQSDYHRHYFFGVFEEPNVDFGLI